MTTGSLQTVAAGLIGASAAIVLVLGALHLRYTFRGRMLHPRDEALLARMREVPLVITRRTTMWKAWVGFNASHSFGLVFFAVVYGYLALARIDVLLGSPVLLGIGLLLLVGYAVLARVYWFNAPLRGVLAATALYAAALVTCAV